MGVQAENEGVQERVPGLGSDFCRIPLLRSTVLIGLFYLPEPQFPHL